MYYRVVYSFYLWFVQRRFQHLGLYSVKRRDN